MNEPKSGSQPPHTLTPRVFLQVELKSQEAQSLQQYVAAYEQLTSEKEALHRQLLLQTQPMSQLQQQEARGKAVAEMARQKLQETQGRESTWKLPPRRTSSHRTSWASRFFLGKVWETTQRKRREPQEEAGTVSSIGLRRWKRPLEQLYLHCWVVCGPLWPHLTGDGGGHLDSEEEEQPRPSIAEALESREAMVAFFNSAGAGAQEEQEQLCVQPQERRVCYQHLAHPVASTQEPEAVAPAPALASGTESESLCVETNQALQGAIEKLQSGFMTLRKEKVDLKERVEKLELLFIRLSGETDMMTKDIKSYEQQRAVPKPWHQEEVEKREIKLEQQEPVFPILGDNEGHAKFLATAKNHVDEPAPGAPAPQELETVNKLGDLCEVSLTDSMEPARDAREGSPQGNPTVGNIEQPVCEMKTFPEHPGLGSNSCVPFFYRAAKNRQISITIV
ncbi:hypothetical protein P7K49_010928 [Saguinus oedipus]|uniref:Golgin subfamily A conserved domain-containing protein n=1 Tax=Saguinus oedipus TaxID=9490 RepID=A0ABQ9VP70_SAGOE|nr:hypothetical protein P7K49_010928 [Saguinus oedipus]